MNPGQRPGSPATGSVVEALRERAGADPRAEAVVEGDVRTDYGGLLSAARAVAGHLRAGGLEPGDRVALLMENSARYIAACYGVLWAGGVVVALNTAARAPDLVNWIEHSGAARLIADARHGELGALLEAMPRALPLIVSGAHDAGDGATAWEQVLAEAPDPGEPRIAATDQLASLIYTSGTTGSPKGVMLTHGNLLGNVEAINEYLGLEASDRTVCVLPFYYSYGNSVLHTHVVAGATLVLVNSLMYPERVLRTLVDERATGFSGVPSTYHLLLGRARLDEHDLSGVRYLTQAGGAMPPAMIDKVRAAMPRARFFVMYGQTEATARLTYLPPERIDDKRGSVGVPVPGVRLEVRDRKDAAVPAGTTGEVCVQGVNVMAGYWRAEDLTAQVLRDGWLHTGDLGYLDEDGFLYLVGRSSDMIKTGAHRVSPNEIEEVIAEIPGVCEVGVAGIPDEVMGQAIRAVVVPDAGATLAVRDIKRYCLEHLARYKIPKEIVFADTLPKTASGKIRRTELVSAREEA